MNHKIISKKTLLVEDYEILKAATKEYVKACYNLKSILDSCAYDQAHSFHSANIDCERLSQELQEIWSKLEQKHGYDHSSIEDIVLIPQHFKEKFLSDNLEVA